MRPDPHEDAEVFCEAYSEFLVRGEQREDPPLRARDLQRVLRAAAHTKGGLDGWQPSELSCVPMCACNMLARMLRRVESGAAWPKQMSVVLTAFVAKGAEHSADPLSYRGLSLLSAVYRSWAKLRLRQLRPWLDSWKHPAMFSAVPGVGAQDAWMEESMYQEQGRMAGAKSVTSVLD
eukprot:15479640-Alexandrium_andersonii.AAC.1